MKSIILTTALLGIIAANTASAKAPFKGTPNTKETENIGSLRHIEVDVDTKTGNKAGIMVSDTTQTGRTANNKFIDFQKMAGMTKRIFVKKDIIQKDVNDVYVARMYNMVGGYKWIPFMPDHSHLGRMSFAQAGNNDVWFGEWADVAPGAKNGSAGINRTVFYSGVNPTVANTLPTSGTAHYMVKGINQYVNAGEDALRGVLTADFGHSKLNGDLMGRNLSLGINAKIKHEDSSFSGIATANNINGVVKGSFFGTGGAALAGVATFDNNKNLDTAFGGSKMH